MLTEKLVFDWMLSDFGGLLCNRVAVRGARWSTVNVARGLTSIVSFAYHTP